MTADRVYVVDKPLGLTSHDVVARARRLLGRRDVGHAGTLDPAASGVLLLMTGEALKLSGYLTSDSKRYRAVVRFGTATSTADAEGELTEQRELPPGWLTAERLAPALDAERARAAQLPPVYSAIKIAGQRAHRLARAGQSVPLEPRPVHVLSLELVELGQNEVTVELHCSKGYYVRSLAVDLGEHLGVPSHLAALRRLASGGFSLSEACTWPLQPESPFLTLEEATARCLGTVTVTEEGVQRALCGKSLDASHFVELPGEDGIRGWLSGDGQLIALGALRSPGEWRVVRGIHRPQA